MCGGQCVAGSVWRAVWRAVCGGWGMIGGGKHDVGQCHSLNLIFGALTATGSHDFSVIGVDNCSLRFCGKGRQLNLGESRPPTQIF